MGSGFDRVAFFYDALARLVFGNRLHRAQTVYIHFLADITRSKPATVLVLGGGTGELLKPLLTQCPACRVLYLEASTAMLARASARMLRQGVAGTVEFRLGTENALRPDERFDAIITPFVLDLFSDETLRTAVIPRLQTALKANGLWLVTDFVPTDSWWQRTLLTVIIYFFRLTAGINIRRLADWSQRLADAGLVQLSQQPHVGGMVSAEVWQVN